MKRVSLFEPEFVISVPNPLEPGKLYVSMEYATVIHLCACGCGNKVVTPLKTAGWELRYNGEGISLYPSVGCWSFSCRSHYWIRQNRVLWSDDWSGEEIREGRKATKQLHLERHRKTDSPADEKPGPADKMPPSSPEVADTRVTISPFTRFLTWLGLAR